MFVLCINSPIYFIYYFYYYYFLFTFPSTLYFIYIIFYISLIRFCFLMCVISQLFKEAEMQEYISVGT